MYQCLFYKTYWTHLHFFTISDWKDYVLETFKFPVGKLFKWPIINDSRPLFLTIFLIIVNVIKGKSDNPVWITQEIWSVRGTLVKFRSMHVGFTAQKMKFSIKDFFSKCDQICRKLPIWSALLKKSFMENFIFCVVFLIIWGK